LGGERVFLIAIADGAGSAAASDLGAQQAVEHILNKVSRYERGTLHIDVTTITAWIEGAREQIAETARQKRLQVRDLACTLLFAVLGESISLFAQVGDGAWIAQANGIYKPITWPSGGEYANQTTFITSPNWREVVQFQIVRQPLSHVAGFTDGLQMLALHFQSRSVHAPFFNPKFTALRAADDETSLLAPLIEYLGSPSLCERTDDDKTLVMACRSEVMLLADSIR
jgi:hypothetical protein